MTVTNEKSRDENGSSGQKNKRNLAQNTSRPLCHHQRASAFASDEFSFSSPTIEGTTVMAYMPAGQYSDYGIRAIDI